MKLQKSTWILIVAAILFGGIVYVYEIEGRPQREAAKAEKNQLFFFEEKDVQSVTVKTKDQTLLFERNNQPQSNNSTQPKWLMTVLEMAKSTQPTPVASATPSIPTPAAASATPPASTSTPAASATPPASTPTPAASATPPASTPTPIAPQLQANLTKVPANEAYVVFLLDQLVKGKGDRVTADPRVDYGLTQPQATIDVKLNDGKTHQLILGKPDFNKTSVYAIADPTTQANQSPEVLVVSNNFENAVNRPLSEWKQPQQPQNPQKK